MGWIQPPLFPNIRQGPGSAAAKLVSQQIPKLAWTGILERSLDSGRLDQVVLRHPLQTPGTEGWKDFPETEDWISIRAPLLIQLWDGAGHTETAIASHYRYQMGCDSFPSFQLSKPAPPGNWKFAISENSDNHWGLDSAQPEQKNNFKIVDLENSQLPKSDWEKMELNLSHQMNSQDSDLSGALPMSIGHFPELKELSSDQLLQQIQKSAERELTALQVAGKNRLLFADLRFTYQGWSADREEMKFDFGIPRQFQVNLNNGATLPFASSSNSQAWYHSYRPSENILIHLKTRERLLLTLSEDPYRSSVTLLSPDGEVILQNFTLGREDCE